MEYCPQCVVELVKDIKQLGNLTVWYVCPKCGLRKREESSYCENKELEVFGKRMRKSSTEELFDEENYLESV